MAGRNGQELLSTWVPTDVAQAFKRQARDTEGGTSAALRRIITEAVEGKPPTAPKGAGASSQVSVRLKTDERRALALVARERGTTPANWIRSLALVHLTRKPAWNESELEDLRRVGYEVAAIGSNVNQIARALNVAVQSGVFPPHQHLAAQEAAELVRSQMHRLTAAITGNYDYWGLPQDERPTPTPGARERRDALAEDAERRRKLRPRKRPSRFKEDEA